MSGKLPIYIANHLQVIKLVTWCGFLQFANDTTSVSICYLSKWQNKYISDSPEQSAVFVYWCSQVLSDSFIICLTEHLDHL